jgi:predicted ATP-binding protein involved in virulence
MIPVRPFAAYGASRLNVSKVGEPEDAIKNFYAEQPELIDITTTLLRDLAANDKTQFDAICQILVELLPNVTEIRKKDPNKVVSDLIFQEKGKTVEFKHLSAGHKSILLMIGDMIIRLAAAQPHITDPRDYAGIVLIDEIEAHLHPKWQKEFPHLLSKFFPKVQFIVTTHSAITLLGMPKNTLIFAVKRDETKGTMVERVDIDLENLLPNHILTSPVFGLDSLFSVTNENGANVRTENTFQEKIENDNEIDELKKRAKTFVFNRENKGKL